MGNTIDEWNGEWIYGVADQPPPTPGRVNQDPPVQLPTQEVPPEQPPVGKMGELCVYYYGDNLWVCTTGIRGRDPHWVHRSKGG